MNSEFKKIKPKNISENVFNAIGNDWMLITAGKSDSFNTMTASWGTMGILWNLPIAICFIRPQRYTFQFAEQNEYYTLSFFESEYKSILNFCGTRSGRDYDKIRETGLKAFETELGNIGFEQSGLLIECKKIYADDIESENFITKELIQKNYPTKDFHRFYIGQIINVWTRKR
jgi:flavin reductase (DIM6/NTAB) family NADH-FMN oxidoreductase RutF